jgi:ABC-2 type transport system permease protein
VGGVTDRHGTAVALLPESAGPQRGSDLDHRAAGPVHVAVAAVGLALLFDFAFGWIGTLLGLLLRRPESVQAASFIIVFPLTFASSVFVPIASMPWWLQAFARHTPMTATVDAVRRLVLGSPNNGEVGLALIWIIGIVIVATATSGVLYRRLAR